MLLDIPAAIADLSAAEARFPDQPSLPAARAQLAMLMDDRAQAQAAIARALSIDPDDPNALEARAVYLTRFEGRLDAALADLERATANAPGIASLWNQTGLVQATRGATREAEAAFRRAIALQPMDPVAYANLAFLYLDQDRPNRAKPLIDQALALDPAFDMALFARDAGTCIAAAFLPHRGICRRDRPPTPPIPRACCCWPPPMSPPGNPTRPGRRWTMLNGWIPTIPSRRRRRHRLPSTNTTPTAPLPPPSPPCAAPANAAAISPVPKRTGPKDRC